MIRLIGLCAGVVLIGACANTSTVSRPAEPPKPVLVSTVKSFESLSFQQPVLGKAIELDFDKKTTKYHDGISERMVHGVRLPQSKNDLVLKVTAKRQGSISAPSIFYPEVWVLDAGFQVRKVLPYENYVFRSGRSGFLEGTFFLKGPAANERYLIVTSREIPDSELKATQTNETKSTLIAPGFAMWMVHTGTSTPPTKMIADTQGEIEVMIAEYKLLTIGR
jgi:Maltose operon periplasmic protein precursor (MalM)